MTITPINPVHFFSFGGGVQSTAIALLLIHQPHRFSKLPDYVLFADPGAESPQTYQHIDRMFELLANAGFKVLIVKPDIPIDESERGLKTVSWFSRNKYSGEISLLRRQCTREYKIDPLQKKMRELLGFAKGKRILIGSAITWLGISTDESRRVVTNKIPWIANFYPLIEMGINRNECQILNNHYLGYNVPKSSCYFCPFTKRQEWERRKIEDPDLFAKAVAIDQKIRDVPKVGTSQNYKNAELFISSSGMPLEDTNHQLAFDLGFERDCSGLCGV